MFLYPLLITTGSNLQTSKQKLLHNHCEGSQNQWAVLFCGSRKVLGKWRCRARCRRARKMRRSPSWHSAKEAPQLDLNGGKCSENAQLSNRTIIVFLGDLGGILHRAEHGHRFRHVSNPLQRCFSQVARII